MSIINSFFIQLGLFFKRLNSFSLKAMIPFFFVSFVMANNAEIYFKPHTIMLKPNENKIIELWVKDIYQIYGAEIELIFNPKYVQLIDINTGNSSIKVEKGNFFDKNKSLIIQNKVNNERGEINYLITLLNPAKAREGEGEIFHFNFQALKLGESEIVFKIAKFGTRKGEVILPNTNNLKIKISTSSILFQKWHFIIGSIFILIIVIIILRIKKQKNN